MPFIIIGALIIGLMLGLMGSGGSILTVPVLVYMLGHDGKVAIAESLAIVGGIALATMLPYAHSRLINWRNVLFFGVPGMAGTYVGAWLSHYVPGAVQLTLFALVMLIASSIMLRNSAKTPDEEADVGQSRGKPKAFWIIGLEGMTVGILTGLVGVGGGFLIVPALVVLGKLPMRVAIGTSLAVIALKSLSGFYKYLDVLESLGASIDWQTVGIFVLLGIIGSYTGHRLATRLNQQLLRRAFAIFLLCMGLFVLAREAPKVIAPPSEQAAVPSVAARLCESWFNAADIAIIKPFDKHEGTLEHEQAQEARAAVVLEKHAAKKQNDRPRLTPRAASASHPKTLRQKIAEVDVNRKTGIEDAKQETVNAGPQRLLDPADNPVTNPC